MRSTRWLIETESAQGGAYNAAAPITDADFSHELGAALPAVALRPMLGEMAGLLLTGQRVIPTRALAQGFRFRRPRPTRALVALLG